MLASSHDHTKIAIKLQTAIIENCLMYRWNEVIPLKTYRRGHLEVGRRGRDVESAGPTPTKN